jgi:hypothetical protein
MNNFQRVGSKSNAHAGNEFEIIALKYFESLGMFLQRNFPVEFGFNLKKTHRFDLGGKLGKETILVECKSHTWTNGNNIPSAKMIIWNEVMLYFSLASNNSNMILFVLKDYSEKRKLTLASYYVKIYKHLIPKGVTIMEYDMDLGIANIVYKS